MSASDWEVVSTPRLFARVFFSPEMPGQICSIAEGLAANPGGFYVVASPEGEWVGSLSHFEIPVLRPCHDRKCGHIVRPASDQEIDRAQEHARIEADSLRFCRQRSRELSLPMRPVSAFVPLDREVIIIAFAAEERVDFRELVKDLTRRVRRRVEFKQIGVRDQAKLSGGWGPCGRILCCTSFMTRFNSVTIRMAKAQKLSLNPSRISGMCGRLMCCLAHEEANPPQQRGSERPA